MDRLTFAIVAITVVALAALPFLRPAQDLGTDGEPALPSLAEALAEDLRTGKITAEEYEQARAEEQP